MGARNRAGIGLSYRPAGAGILQQSMGGSRRVEIGLSYRLAGAGILEQSMGVRNRVGIAGPGYIGWRKKEKFPWNRFLGSLKA